MQRIQDATAVTSLPAPPTLTGQPVGFFQGSAAGGIVTRIRYWWLNMIQEELCALLTQGGLPLDGSATVLQAVQKLRTITVTRRIITSSGTYTPPANLLFADVEVIGGGGGGGGATGGSNTSSAGGGAGGGGYARAFLSAAQIGASQAVTVGAYGAGSAYGNNSGGNGSGSAFGGYLTGGGGIAGVGCAAYSGSAPGGGAGNGGAASSTLSGAIVIPGQAGEAGITFAAGASGIGGIGGASRYGYGGQQGFQTDSGSAPPGTGYGSGGAGSGRSTSSLGGGTGAPGVVIVTEYCTAA